MDPVLWLTLILLLIGTTCDLRRREIPDAVPLALLVIAVVAKGFGWADQSWLSLFGGWALGLAIGLVLFWFGGFGGGDAKVLASLGAVIGVPAMGSVLFYTAVAGGVLAGIALIRGVKDVPYVPAITAGFVVSWIMGGTV
jgi:Flp pilus assembly protein protease CpaA